MPRHLVGTLLVLGLLGCTEQDAVETEPVDLGQPCTWSSECPAYYRCSAEHGDYSTGDGYCVRSYLSCGNRSVQPHEVCDDGYRDACGSCNGSCTGPGTGSVCGDDVVCPETEGCEGTSFPEAECLDCDLVCRGLPARHLPDGEVGEERTQAIEATLDDRLLRALLW